VKRSDVKLSQHDWRIVVETGSHQITAYQGANIFLQEPIAVGKQDTPTPGGVYYIKELLKPPNPNTVYGPYAYGLSGFSNVLTTFNGGEGVIGIHGNNDASVLGHDVSHGCIRMSNPGITKLVSVLPLGVPVEIRST
jgi:lipoprotein-anchoring transpeptidase ErfK/SrfK